MLASQAATAYKAVMGHLGLRVAQGKADCRVFSRTVVVDFSIGSVSQSRPAAPAVKTVDRDRKAAQVMLEIPARQDG